MIDRRKFITALGASTVVPRLPALQGEAIRAAPAPTEGLRSLVSLNGEWERRIDGVPYDAISVPSSQRPSGFYHLSREFPLPRLAARERAILHFDAITYYGEVSVNGKKLGAMAPYVPYEFEFTDQAREGANRVQIAIADAMLTPSGGGKAELELGISPGWEAYGGIIRDVCVETRPAVFIDNVKFGYILGGDYRSASCQVTVFVSSRETALAEVEVSLNQGRSEVSQARKSFRPAPEGGEVELQFNLPAPALWSPEEPNLYQLNVRLRSEAGEDEWRTRTGFREVRIQGNQFLLNGEPLVLKGVCRHDMWKGEGFTLTQAQREQDMRMIKELGCNFVRLVHYPHDRRVIELADELGLFVSEEPGYWGMDFTKMQKSTIDLGYEILERTIRRDWNSPSVFAWLLGNECELTVEYLREGKARCRRLDPLSRPVSFANSMPMEQAKPIYEQAGLDFFDQHIYTFDVEEFRRTAQFYGSGKPFTVTEWGAMAYGQSRPVMENTVDTLIELIGTKQVAGHSYWEWADMMQFGRTGWNMRDGVLEKGVVTQNREPREEVYMELGRLFERRLEAAEPAPIAPTVVRLRQLVASPGSTFAPVSLQSLVQGPDGQSSWAELEAGMAKYWAGTRLARDQWRDTGDKFVLWQASEVQIAGIPFHLPVVEHSIRPLVFTPESPEVSIPIKSECLRLHILGQVTFPEGFPVVGEQGELIATYRLVYADGKEQTFPIRNGIEAAQANLIHEATRVNPIATAAQRALVFVKDPAREHYQVLLWPTQTRKATLDSIHCKLEVGRPMLAIFAITAEHAG